jgi:hypothetical protein
MDNYKLQVHKESHISNDPNDWSTDPRYIVDLLRKLVTVSVETVRIVGELPALEEHVAVTEDHVYEVARSIEKLSDADSKAFYATLPKWVASQKVTHALALNVGLQLGSDDKTIGDFAKTTPRPIELKDDCRLKKMSDAKAYSAIAVFPSGATRTIGEVNDGKIEFFGYWALFDPDEDMTEDSLSAQLNLQLNFVVVEAKNGNH